MVRAAGGTVRAAIEQLSAAGFGTVQLDATLPGLRPRDLDPRARKDLLAMLNRRGMRPGGIDLFIPRKHYVTAEHADRAMSAAISGITLAADLGRLPVSLALPVKTMADDARRVLVEAADGHGVRLAVHAEDQLEALQAWVEEVDLPALGIGVDPAALLARGKDPTAVLMQVSKRLAVARLSDIERGGGSEDEAGETVRVAVGDGDLDVVQYRVAVDLASVRTGPVVLDLKGLVQPLKGAQRGKRAWDNAGITI